MTVLDPAHLVGAGGMIGAILRYLVNQAIDAKEFPFGTLTVNVIGSFILGFITFLGVSETVLLLVGTGLAGSFTTFSSFSVDTVELWEDGRPSWSAVYATANIVGALIAMGLAWLAVRFVDQIQVT